MHRGFARGEKSRVWFFFLVSESWNWGGAGEACVCVNDEVRGGGREGGGSEGPI